MISSAPSSQRELISGVLGTAMVSALAATVRRLMRLSRNAGMRRASSSSSSDSVTSTVRNSVACGAVKALRTMASAVRFRTPAIGIRVSRCRESRPDDAEAGITAACWTGSSVALRPATPSVT
jgi:hypothetical protein